MNNFAFSTAIVSALLLASCQTTTGGSSSSTVARAPAQNVDICTHEGRVAANPPVSSDFSTLRNQQQTEIATGDWHYRRYLVYLEASEKCPNVNKAELRQHAAVELKSASTFYEFAYDTQSQINAQKRQQSAAVASLLGSAASGLATGAAIAATNNQNTSSSSSGSGYAGAQCRPVDVTCKPGSPLCALPRCP